MFCSEVSKETLGPRKNKRVLKFCFLEWRHSSRINDFFSSTETSSHLDLTFSLVFLMASSTLKFLNEKGKFLVRVYLVINEPKSSFFLNNCDKSTWLLYTYSLYVLMVTLFSCSSISRRSFSVFF